MSTTSQGIGPPRTHPAEARVFIATSLMCGLMGLAGDLGWGYLVKQSAKRAADAAAMAAVEQSLAQAGQESQSACGAAITCPAAGECSSARSDVPAKDWNTACSDAEQIRRAVAVVE